MSSKAMATALLSYGADLKIKNIVAEIFFSILPSVYMSDFELIDNKDELIVDMFFQYVKSTLKERNEYQMTAQSLVLETYPDLKLGELTSSQISLLAELAIKRVVFRSLGKINASMYAEDEASKDLSKFDQSMSKKRFLNSIVNKILLIEPTNKLSFLNPATGKKWTKESAAIKTGYAYTSPKYCFEGYIRLKAKKLEDIIVCIDDLTGLDPTLVREIISRLIKMFVVFYNGNEDFNTKKPSRNNGVSSITTDLRLEELNGKTFVCSSNDFDVYMKKIFLKGLEANTIFSDAAATIIENIKKELAKKKETTKQAVAALIKANKKSVKLAKASVDAQAAAVAALKNPAANFGSDSASGSGDTDLTLAAAKAADAADAAAAIAAAAFAAVASAANDAKKTKNILDTAEEELETILDAEEAAEIENKKNTEKLKTFSENNIKSIMNALFDSISMGVRLSVDVYSNNDISALAKQKGFIEKTIFYTSNDDPAGPQGHFTVPLAQKEQRFDPSQWSKVVTEVNKFAGADLVDILNLDNTKKVTDMAALLIALLKTKEFDALVKSVLVPAMLFNTMSVIPNIEIARDIIPIMRQSGVFKGMDEVLNEMFSSLSGYLLGDFPWSRDCSDLAGLL
jgi:hypothetical protein